MSARKSVTFLSNRFVVVLLVASLGFLSFVKFNQIREQRKLDREIQSLKSESKDVEEKNKQIEDSLKYLSSQSAADRIAHQQLNKKRDGEIAVVFMPTASATTTASGGLAESNPKTWWNYFFSRP